MPASWPDGLTFYPKILEGDSGRQIKALWEFMREQEPDWVADLHEGYDFHGVNPKSSGSSIIYFDTPEMQKIAAKIYDDVNKTVDDPERTIVKDFDTGPVNGGLVRGAIERLGLGYDVVRELNPKIIYAQVKGYAQDGPHADYLSFDMIGQSVGGLLSITGERDGVPIKPGPTIGDTGTGMLMCISILSAYVQRMRTGKGQRIQLAMQDAMIQYSRTLKIS